MPPRVTILTRPQACGLGIALAKKSFDVIRGAPAGAHRTLILSTIHGLRATGVRVSVNPAVIKGNAILVAGGIQTLRDAIKRRSKGQKVVALPSTFTSNDEMAISLHSKEMRADLCIVASPHIIPSIVRSHPEVADVIEAWPAGTDLQFWSARQQEKDAVMVYFKGHLAPEHMLETTLTCLRDRKEKSIVVRYGDYTPKQYRAALRRSRYSVFINGPESQGLALAEAWACDVPTVVWLNASLTHPSHPAPFLSPTTGRLHPESDDLRKTISAMLEQHELAPRRWMEKNQSLHKAGTNLLSLLRTRGIL